MTRQPIAPPGDDIDVRINRNQVTGARRNNAWQLVNQVIRDLNRADDLARLATPGSAGLIATLGLPDVHTRIPVT